MKLTHRVLSLIMVMVMLMSSCAFATELPVNEVIISEEHDHEHDHAEEIIETEMAEAVESDEAETVEPADEFVIAALAEDVVVEEVGETDLLDPTVFELTEEGVPYISEMGEDEVIDYGIFCEECGDNVQIDYYSGGYSGHTAVCVHGIYGQNYYEHVNDDGEFSYGSYEHYWYCDLCDYDCWGQHYTDCDEEDLTKCLECGYTSTYISIEVKHELAEDYTTDAEGHWYDCSRCDEKVYYAEHYAKCTDIAEDGTATCQTCKAEGVTIGSVYHNYQGNYYATAEGHYYFCEDCQQPYDTVMEHYAYCTAKNTCDVCDYVSDTELDRFYHEDVDYSTYRYDEEGHYYWCDACDSIYDEKSAHSAYCDTPTECRSCDYVASNGYIAKLYHNDYDYKSYVPYGEEGHGYKCNNESCPTGVVYGPYEHVGLCTDPSTCRDCGYKSTETEFKAKHGPINYEVYVQTEDGKGHGYLCETCNGAYYYQDYEGNEPFEHRAEDCTKPNECSRCGYVVESDDIYISISHGEVDYDTYVPTENGKGHYYKCLTCNKAALYRNDDEGREHKGSCLDPYTCKECGYKTEYKMETSHQYDDENRKFDDKYHWAECTVCGASQNPSEHWADCDADNPNKCGSCDYESENGENILKDHTYWKDNQEIFAPGTEGHHCVCFKCGEKSDYQYDHYVDCTAEDKTVCSGCGVEITGYFDIEHDIDWGEVQYDEYRHWYLCDDCGAAVNAGDHYSPCRLGETDVCYDCKAKGVIVNVEHDWWGDDDRRDYVFDKNGHQMVCDDCGTLGEKDDHWANCTDPNTCTNCGYYSEAGFGDVSHDAPESSREYDDEYHWYTCDDCHQEVYKYEHEAYCNNHFKCRNCDYVSETELDYYHRLNWDNPVSTTETQHTFGCVNCDYTETSVHYVSCTSNSNRCEECGAEVSASRISHYWGNNWIAADDGKHCYRACNRCGKIVSWNEHYAICGTNECGRCGVKLGDDADIDHVYDRDEIAKTDAKYHYFKCEKCGASVKGYHYRRCNEDKCETCGVSGSEYTLRESHYNIVFVNKGKTHEGVCSDCGETFTGEHEGDCYDGGVCWSCGATENVTIYHVSGKTADECVYCQGTAPNPQPPVVDGATVTLNKSAVTLGVGETFTLTADASHGSTVTYSTGDKAKATVSADGKITAKATGTVVITAKADSTGAQATCTVTVKKAPTSINVTPATLTLGVGETASLTATLSANSASKITFSATAGQEIVSFDQEGNITALKAGTIKVYAKTFNKKSDYCTITVKAAPEVVTVTSSKNELSVGQTAKLTTKLTTLAGGSAAGAYTYTADPANCATIENGVLTAVEAGTVTVTSTTYLPEVNGTVEINILPAPDKVKVENVVDNTVTLGLKETFTLKAVIENNSPADITFTSGNKNVATVSTSGKITTKKTGTAVITVAPHQGEAVEITVNVVAAPKSVKLNAKKLTLGVGEETTLKATLSSSKSASALKWKSSKTSVVEVDQNGKLTAKKAGTATITVTTFNGKKTTCTVYVKAAPEVVTVTSAKTVMSVGQTTKLTTKLTTLAGGTAAGAYTYTAEPANCATIENGVLTAVEAGTVIVTSTTYLPEVKGTVEITILPAPDKAQVDNLEELALTLGVKETFTLKVSAENGSPADFTFTSDKSSVASVGLTSGKITAKKTGTAVITATPHQGEPVEITVTVKAAPKSVKLNAKKLTLGVGEETTLKATLSSSNSASALKWKSSKTSVVEVDQNGNLNPKKAGTATITVSTFNGKKATCTVTVKAAPVGISLSPATLEMGIDQTYTLKPVITKNSASKLTYTIEGNAVTVTSAGKITAVEEGNATITVSTFNGHSAQISITVKKKPTTLALPTYSTKLGTDLTLDLKAILGVGEGGLVTYTSSDSKIASVSSNGIVTAKKAGTAKITVKTYNGLKATCTVKVFKSIASVLSAPFDTMAEVSQVVTSLKDRGTFYSKGNFRFLFNSADGIILSWGARNISNKTIKYITFTVKYYNSVDDVAYDSITKKSTKTIKLVGPIAPGQGFMFRDIIGYSKGVAYGVITDVKVDFTDGTSKSGTYGYTTWHDSLVQASPDKLYVIN